MAGIPAGRPFIFLYFLYFTFRTLYPKLFLLTRLCARRSRLPAYTFGPVWPVSSFYISSMDYCPSLLHLRLNILNNLKSNVPRDPSAKIFLHGRKPRPLQSWYQREGLALGKQMNITKGKIGIKVHT